MLKIGGITVLFASKQKYYLSDERRLDREEQKENKIKSNAYQHRYKQQSQKKANTALNDFQFLFHFKTQPINQSIKLNFPNLIYANTIVLMIIDYSGKIRYKSNQMIKNKSTITCQRPLRQSMRPISSTCYIRKTARSSTQIHNIIHSLQKNVKELKQHCLSKHQITQKINNRNHSQQQFRVVRTQKNGSQNKQQVKDEQKNENDIFEIRNQFLKVNGRLTNSVIELYQFYKKHMDKREKSTRIMMSMQLSGGQSISGGKESLLKHSQLANFPSLSRKEKDQSKIQEKKQQMSGQTQSHAMNDKKKPQKTSHLAKQLMSKGFYNVANLSNLLSSKRYKITKDKQDSFKRSKLQKNKELIQIIENKEKQLMKENDMNKKNIIIFPSQSHFADKLMPIISEKESFTPQKSSPCFVKKQEISFKMNTQEKSSKMSKKQSLQLSSISKQEKDIEVQFLKDLKQQGAQPKIQDKIIDKKMENLLDLQESPIKFKKNKGFETSKFYVAPVPQIKKNIGDESISLRSTSRIIDVDSLPFDL